MIDHPPYFYLCRKCGHEFTSKYKWIFFCPKCKAFDIVPNPRIVK